MRKIKILFTLFIAAMVFLTVACKKNSDEPEKLAAKYLTSTQFITTNWTGKDAKGNDVTLAVNSTTEMILTYFAAKSISKNTNSQEKKTVKIAYIFDEVDGTFSGTGDDQNSYSGTLTSDSELSLKMLSEQVAMKKN